MGTDEFEKGLLDLIAFTLEQTSVLVFKCLLITAKLRYFQSVQLSKQLDNFD